jgi:hypothetical protein
VAVAGGDLGSARCVDVDRILIDIAFRREGQEISAWKFLALGLLVMPAALLASLGSFSAVAFR